MQPTANQYQMTPAEWGMLLTLSALWGGSFFFTGVAVRELPTFTVVVSRVVLAALVLQAVMRLQGQSLPQERNVWLAFLGMGLLNNVVPFSLIVWGQSHIASGVASICNATTPLFTVLVAHVCTRDEKLSRAKLLGVGFGLAGVAVMVGGAELVSPGVEVWAQAACLAAALSYAFAGIYGRRFRAMGVSPLATATGQVTASSLVLLPIMLLADEPWSLPLPSLEAVGALVGIACLSTALAYLLYFRILATVGATNLLLVTFLIPVSAILLGTLVLGEVLLPRHFRGMALIGLGLAAIDGRPVRIVFSLLSPKRSLPKDTFEDGGGNLREVLSMSSPQDERRWQAVRDRDTSQEDVFVYAVRSTGIYCRPGCPSRLAKRKNVLFFTHTAKEAEAAGFRPCKRCKPDRATAPPHLEAVTRACESIQHADEEPPLGETWRVNAGLSPGHFQRLVQILTLG